MIPPRGPSCPTDLELELVQAGDAAAARRSGAHAGGCALCAERVAWMNGAADQFRARAFPATREAVVAELAPPRRSIWSSWLPAPVAMAAAVAVLLVALPPGGPPAGYVGSKGGDVAGSFEIYLGEHGQGRRLAPGEQVHPGDGLRFVVEAPGRSVFVFTVDARGQLSRLYPASGAAPVPAPGLFPGGAVLDGVIGPERVFVVYADDRLGWPEVEAAARAGLAGGGPEAVRRLERLPLAAPQDSVLLEKVPR